MQQEICEQHSAECASVPQLSLRQRYSILLSVVWVPQVPPDNIRTGLRECWRANETYMALGSSVTAVMYNPEPQGPVLRLLLCNMLSG